MGYEIIPTKYFGKCLKGIYKKYPKIKDDILSLQKELLENPQMGTPLGKDCYKIRMQISGKNVGKSGGARVITCVRIVRKSVYLLAIYDKADFSTIDDDALEAMLRELL